HNPNDNRRLRDAGQFLFFFQAEDGIRDRNVTGVQTCALPIFAAFGGAAERGRLAPEETWVIAHLPQTDVPRVEAGGEATFVPDRSEERRVGKGWRSRWVPQHERNNSGDTVCLVWLVVGMVSQA